MEFASVSLLVAFAASDAFAQGAQPGAGQTSPGAQKSEPSPGAAGQKGTTGSPGAAGSAGAPAGASQGPWTANNVTAARPFGEINVQAAGNTPESVRTWAQSRSASERAELRGRCDVITNPSNSSRYDTQTQQFCRNYMMVAAVNPPGGATSPSTQPGGQLSSPPGGAGKTTK